MTKRHELQERTARLLDDPDLDSRSPFAKELAGALDDWLARYPANAPPRLSRQEREVCEAAERLGTIVQPAITRDWSAVQQRLLDRELLAERTLPSGLVVAELTAHGLAALRGGYDE